MKPALTAEQERELEAKADEMAANPPDGLAFLGPLIARPGPMREVVKSGHWLQRQLREIGATCEQIDAIGFAHGQMCFGADPWDKAVDALAKFKAGKPDQPGLALAVEIFDEVTGRNAYKNN